MNDLSKENYDFSCYLIKYDRESIRGLIYQKDSLQSEGEYMVPLIWNYQHYYPNAVLGSALLEHRDDGVYAYCKFFDNDGGNKARKVLEDCNESIQLAPYVNRVKIDGKYVVRGSIRSANLILDRVDSDDCYRPVWNIHLA